MKALVKELLHLTEVRQLTEDVRGGVSPVLVTGVGPVHRAQVEAALHRDSGRPLWVLCADEREARRQAGDLAVLTGETPLVLPARELQWRPMESSRQWENQRLAALYRLADSPVVVTTPDALVQRCIPPRVLERTALTLAVGQQWDLNALTRRLAGAGYTRCDQVEGPGQFALRGGILDVFSPGMEQPVRCEFFDDEIDSLGIFDTATQRRVENRREALLLPAAEVLPAWQEGQAEQAALRLETAVKRLARKQGTQALRELLTADAARLRQGMAPNGPDRCLAAVYPEKTTALDYLPENALVCVEESGRTAEALRGWLWQLKEDVSAGMEAGFLAGELADFAASEQELAARLEKRPTVQLDSLTTGRQLLPPRDLLQLTAKQLSSYGGSLELACTDLTHYLTSGYRVMVLCGGEVRARNLQQMLADRKIPAAVDLTGEKAPEKGTVLIAVGALSAGCEYPEGRLAVLTEGQLTTPLSGRSKKPRPKRDSNQQKLQSYTDLTPGDLVVHAHHGIGRFVAMLRLPVDGVEKDYIKIAYAGQDVLYVPATSLDLVSKYIGPGEDNERTKLNKLGGTEWAKTTRKAKAAAKDLAEGLIRLYAQRQRLAGHAFSPDSPWQQEFEDAFPYTETDDQLQAIRDIKADMEQPRPMDRLLCGDVGYGKTEVAFRAVMKCVLDGKQAAVLVPTTVLARQHFLNALRRFAKYPVTIDVVSRFRTSAQMKETLRRVESGEVDILIGTHRLFNRDVRFKDLGLLVVDEEQRFGVQHKEKLKENFRQVDVLTLSATPIPRTLNMALSGIRDMSTLEEPPADRQPVQTYVLEHDWGVLGDAMRRELERGGQVYYLHNRVETIDRTASRIQAMLGEDAAVGVAHGKMTQEAIDEVMSRMTDGELNVLVCTTIIETGIDLPNANTLIIEDADRLGLAQLHQIRGRVGRSSRRAYAYLTYRRGKVLTEVAAKRLSAIREFAEFGSGFKIAMRDLEIRGAGNVLGPEQSGFLLSVGYDMYLKLLEEAVLQEQGQPVPPKTECAADLSVAASVPDRYVPSPEQRMDLYRRIAAIRSEAEADDLVDELIDRYGEPPRTVNNLISVALLRAAAAEAGITDIAQKQGQLVFTLARFSLEQFSALCAMDRYQNRLLLTPGEVPRFTFRLKKGEDALRAARQVVDDFAGAEG